MNAYTSMLWSHLGDDLQSAAVQQQRLDIGSSNQLCELELGYLLLSHQATDVSHTHAKLGLY